MRLILALLYLTTAAAGWTQDSTKVSPTYTNTIFRKPFPDYLVEKKSDGRLLVYRTYSNTIFRKPFPGYVVEKGKIYPTYSNSIFRKPFPLKEIGAENEAP